MFGHIFFFFCSRYFNEYFPRAAQVAQQLRDRPGSPERLVFLTHSWLVSLFLDCAARIGIQCPNATTVADVRQAVQQGDIVWHALPHNAQVELYDASLLQVGGPVPLALPCCKISVSPAGPTPRHALPACLLWHPASQPWSNLVHWV